MSFSLRYVHVILHVLVQREILIYLDFDKQVLVYFQQPTPVFLPGESRGQGCLVGCHLWGRTESGMTEAT